MSAFLQFLERRSLAVLGVLTLLFLGLESFYAVHRPLSLDEFNGAWSAAQLSDGVPYRDFQPYKPVLGYWLQLSLMRLAPDTWSGYLAVRLGMSALCVGVLFLGALWLRRLYRADAVCLAYALLIGMSSLVEWAIEVRVDMLTALFGFVSLLLLLNRRVALAGLAAGIGFLISQKGTMYAVAGAVSLLGCLAIQRERRYGRDVLVYGTCIILPIGLYVLGWSLVASFPRVWETVFAQPTQLRALTTPAHGEVNFYQLYWLETLRRNPLFYGCAVWALGSLLVRGRDQSPRETLLLCYGGAAALVMVSLRQPWRYSFVLIVPTMFVLLIDLFAREFARPTTVLRRPVAWLCFLVLGLLVPLARVPVVARDDPGWQRQSVELTEALLEPGDRYFAGFQFLYRGDRHARSLLCVDMNGSPPISSLTESELTAILERLKEEPIRVVVYTYKIDEEVPEPIRTHLYRNYAPLWANVWIYAPQVKPADGQVDLLFTASYTLETEQPQVVLIDGQTYSSGATVELDRGRHTIVTPVRLRLKLQTARIAQLLKPQYREPIGFFWPEMTPTPPHARAGVWMDD